jgi:hypothetical protein
MTLMMCQRCGEAFTNHRSSGIVNCMPCRRILVCHQCGGTFKRAGNTQKFCFSCARSRANEQERASYRRKYPPMARMMLCEQCGRSCERITGTQKFCVECSRDVTRQRDRVSAKRRYKNNPEPSRTNSRRHRLKNIEKSRVMSRIRHRRHQEKKWAIKYPGRSYFADREKIEELKRRLRIAGRPILLWRDRVRRRANIEKERERVRKYTNSERGKKKKIAIRKKQQWAYRTLRELGIQFPQQE